MFDFNFDNLVKNLEIVMPDLIRHPERIEFTGFRLQFIPQKMRGRNDGKENFSAFYEVINHVYPVILSDFFKKLKIYQLFSFYSLVRDLNREVLMWHMAVAKASEVSRLGISFNLRIT